MGLNLQIKKQINQFELNVSMDTTKRRIGILGASGCGKSMTLKCIAGIMTPDSGRIVLDGQVLYDGKTNVKARDRKVGYLFQNYALFPTMTVKENIMVGMKLSKREKKSYAEELIRRFSLEGLADRLPAELSGGQQQRTALARIIACDPKIILLDEPFSALDSHLKEQMQLELECMLESFMGTVVMVSHSRDELYRFSEELIVMEDGKQVEAGETKELFYHPKKKETARLTGCKNISRIRKISDRLVYAIDWDFNLGTAEVVGDEIRYIGIRAHDLILTDQIGENVIETRVTHEMELPFERQYLLEKKKVNEKVDDIWWKRGKEERIIEKDSVFVLFPKEKLMLLR